MNEEHFLLTLKIYLKPLPTKEVEEILNTYQAQFNELAKTDLTPEEISQKLGNPKQIAQQILTEHHLNFVEPSAVYQQHGWEPIFDDAEDLEQVTQNFDQQENDQAYLYQQRQLTVSPARHFIQISCALFVTCTIVIWLFFGLFATLLGFLIASIALFLSPLFCTYILFFSVTSFSLLQFFLSVLFCGLALIGFIILIPLIKGAWKLFKIYFRWLKRLMAGGADA